MSEQLFIGWSKSILQESAALIKHAISAGAQANSQQVRKRA